MKCLKCGTKFYVIYNVQVGLPIDYCPFCGAYLLECGWEDDDGENLGSDVRGDRKHNL